MSKFEKTKRTPLLTDAELAVMPLDALRTHAKDSDKFARMLASEAARATRVYKRRRRAEQGGGGIVIESNSGVFEIVLPRSGKFARINPIRWLDVIIAGTMPTEMILPTLAARIVTLDGETMTAGAWAEADYEDIAPVAEEVLRRLKRSRGEAA